MELSKLTIPLIESSSIIALLFIVFSIVVGIRGGWNAGLRLLLLGFGMLCANITLWVFFFLSSDRIVISFLFLSCLSFWCPILGYLAMQWMGGRTLLELPRKKKWSASIRTGAFFVIVGLGQLIRPGDLFSPAKYSASGIALIFCGIYAILERIRHIQIKEKGILNISGSFYSWSNIDSYVWKFTQGILSIRLKKAFLRSNINLDIQPQFMQEMVAYLEKNKASANRIP